MNEIEKLKSLRTSFRADYSETIPIDFVSITKNARGDFGLAVHIRDNQYKTAVVPKQYHGFFVKKQRSSEFELH